VSEPNYHIPMTARDVVFLDTETSGLDPDVHEVIELAAVRLSPNLQYERGRVDRKCILARPEVAEAKALEVNRYNALEWRDATPVRVALVDFTPLVDKEVILVGHNAHFDWAFLRRAYQREGLAFPQVKYVIDTVSMVFPLVMRGDLPRLSLETICARYRIPNDGQHRAMADVRRLAKAYAALLGRAPPRFGVRAEEALAPTAPRREIVQPMNVSHDIVDPFAGVPHEEEIPSWAR
jgi:DNA polymerase III subunit epsilon